MSPGKVQLKSKVSSWLLVTKITVILRCMLLPDPGRSAAFVSPGARRSVSCTRHWRHPRHNNGFKGQKQQREHQHRHTAAAVTAIVSVIAHYNILFLSSNAGFCILVALVHVEKCGHGWVCSSWLPVERWSNSTQLMLRWHCLPAWVVVVFFTKK